MATPWEIVKRPFRFDEIEVKCQTLSKTHSNGVGKALATPYFDARAVMDRLDEAFGPAGWCATYREVVVGGRTAFLCHLEVEAEGKKVVREDGSDCSDIEATKGGISGSLKRAFSALGNRWLYGVDLGWHECTINESNGKTYFGDWTSSAKKKMRADYDRQIQAQLKNTQIEDRKDYLDPRDVYDSFKLTRENGEELAARAKTLGLKLSEFVVEAYKEGDRVFLDLHKRLLSKEKPQEALL